MKLAKIVLYGFISMSASFAVQAKMIFSIDDKLDASAATIVEDNGVGDNFDTLEGYLDFNGAVGSWYFNDVTAISSPWIGTDNEDVIHLDSLNVSSSNGGELSIMLTQTDLTRLSSPYSANFGGVSGGIVNYQLFLDSTNTAFGQGTLLYDSTINHSGGFYDDFGGSFSLAGLYSMTMVINIKHTANKATSFNYQVTIPEPASIALLGSGLVLVGFAGRRRQKQ